MGSNTVHRALSAGHEVLTTFDSCRPTGREPYRLEPVDMLDSRAVTAGIRSYRPDLVIRCAIVNDLRSLYLDRRAAWSAYVEATRSTAEAASGAGAAYVLVSADWVFDGTRAGADESTPPNPVNLYGVLKTVSEVVTLERGGAVARVSGVNGIHRARPCAPRAQRTRDTGTSSHRSSTACPWTEPSRCGSRTGSTWSPPPRRPTGAQR